MKAILVDTHAWIWYMLGDPTIKKSVNIINSAIKNNTLHLAAISLWEIAMLAEKNRIILGMPCIEWINKSITATHLHIVPINPLIAVESSHLPGKFHSDPADRLIVATARTENYTILTRDKNILAYSKQKYVSALPI